MGETIEKHLPLTESTAYILLALAEPLHGYGVMQKVETISEATVKIGPGTLYGAFSALEEAVMVVFSPIWIISINRMAVQKEPVFLVLTFIGFLFILLYIYAMIKLIKRFSQLTKK